VVVAAAEFLQWLRGGQEARRVDSPGGLFSVCRNGRDVRRRQGNRFGDSQLSGAQSAL